MNKLELAGFTNLMNEIEPNEETISEYLDKCIEEAEKTNINTKWFIRFKAQIECELKMYADKHYYPRGRVIADNRVERTENGLIVLLGKKIKYKDKIFVLYFPSEFNNNFVLARSIYC